MCSPAALYRGPKVTWPIKLQNTLGLFKASVQPQKILNPGYKLKMTKLGRFSEWSPENWPFLAKRGILESKGMK